MEYLHGASKTDQNSPSNGAGLVKWKGTQKPDTVLLSGQQISIRSVLLTGATGFLGAHLLHELVQKTNITVFCLVRSSDIQSAEERLRKILDFYFPEQYADLIGSRIFVVSGDITEKGLGMKPSILNTVATNIDAVIHAAALVKHYGHYEQSHIVNVEGTRNITDFCLKYQKPLNLISTTAVSGNHLVNQDMVHIAFTENDFFIGQNYEDNVYVKSKLEAENIVLTAMLGENLKTRIFRVGILTGRYSDGVFQPNIDENALYNRIKSLAAIGSVPQYLLNQEVQFTPVDLCAQAIIKLLLAKDAEGKIFHVYNHRLIRIKYIIEAAINLGVTIAPMENTSFNRLIREASMDSERYELLTGIVNDFLEERNLDYRDSIIVDSSITQEYLEQTGFNWPEIDQEYIGRVIEYMKAVQYLAELNH